MHRTWCVSIRVLALTCRPLRMELSLSASRLGPQAPRRVLLSATLRFIARQDPAAPYCLGFSSVMFGTAEAYCSMEGSSGRATTEFQPYCTASRHS